MRPAWVRYKKWCVILSRGGITLGLLQAFDMISFGQIFESVFQTFLAILSYLLPGSTTSSIFQLLGGGGLFGGAA